MKNKQLTVFESFVLKFTLFSILDVTEWDKELESYSPRDRVIVGFSKSEYLALKRILEKI